MSWPYLFALMLFRGSLQIAGKDAEFLNHGVHGGDGLVGACFVEVQLVFTSQIATQPSPSVNPRGLRGSKFLIPIYILVGFVD